MKVAKIKTVKYVNKQGIKVYKILGFENVAGAEELPQEYLEKLPHFFSNTPEEIFASNVGKIWVDREYRPDFWEDTIQILKQSGERLHQIMERIRKEKETWKGEEVFEI